MAVIHLLWPMLFCWSVGEVYCQTFPYVSFHGQTLANHSYVDLSQVGDHDGGDSVECHTDLTTCCTNTEGSHRGDWYFPNGTRLPFSAGTLFDKIYEYRDAQRVDLRRRNNATSPTGIYRCDIPTNAVHDDIDMSVRDTVYMGLYTGTGGDVTIAGGVTYDLSTQTLTCISTGGPATTVTWTRDSTTLTQGNNTVLVNTVTGQYIHTLNVTFAGEYTCTVTNNKPSNSSASINVAGAPPPTGVTAVQNGPTSIRIAWTPPDPLDRITGYAIFHTGGGSSGIVVVNDRSSNSLTLANLHSGETYTISIASTLSVGLPSAATEALPVDLVPFPSPTLNSYPRVTLTTITITGRVPIGSVVTGFVVQWQRYTSFGCSGEDKGAITVNSTFATYVITGLEPGNRYSITVRLFNAAGSGPVSQNVTATTAESVPSSPPPSFRRDTITPNSITVHWGEVECLHRNGVITGYTIQVSKNGRVEGTVEVGGNVLEATVTGLTPSTTYSVQVAAVNSAGTGPLTSSIFFQTEALVVGLERASYTVSESVEAVEICITAVGANTPCLKTESFQVTLSTTEGSAVSPSDFEALSEVLTFAPCDTQHCVNVVITDDLVNEPEETFYLSLSKISPFINLSTAAGEVLITDDDDKPEGVRFLPLNATAVRISWSGSIHFPTSVLYTVYCSTTIMRQYEGVYPPGVTSTADIVLEDDITLTDIYIHNFTLYYVIPDHIIPNQNVTIFTFDKGVFQIQFGPFYYCLDSVFKKNARAIEEQLQSYLIDIIRKSCPECYSLTRTFLRPGLFLCHGNPTKTTYRTTLVNPFPTTNSTALVGIIQSWVSTGPSLVLDGLLVRISPSCPTSISSLDEEECETGLGERITQTQYFCALRDLGEEICSLGGGPLSSG